MRLGAYQRRQEQVGFGKVLVTYLGSAALAGAIIGIGSVALDPDGRAAAAATLRPLAVRAGMLRARDPRPGDHWAGCNEARAAGTAPIYSGEPGYRPGMDGDSDGIACEPVPEA